MLNMESIERSPDVVSILLMIAAVAAVLTIFMPMLESDTLGRA
jgi:hypothetical protein